uniref:NADH-ubiquinone oxidoreductase chain 5 n=1 Tax=Prosopocoilus laterotarsus maedaorum TaxID=618908 RepID=A0A7H1DJK1_9SCAR|nr:NADH dehydrogenase subunit 5 [Prosopocoilus laterotarsus]QNS37143.1 NADH dehydrogenase subunit 5 [Prosopocoilus laterotarsus maedaorum]UTM10034.1 NADH dehydrogenase subunit 5 [Prosopocoilus laterotarsus]
MSVCLVYFFSFFIFSMVSLLMSLNFMSLDYSVVIEVEMVSVNSCSVVMSLLFDWMSFLFASFVLFISSMVIFYSLEYMEGDLNINRFIMLVAMFVFSMLLLIFSPNLISILLGWDGLGLVSYCLVIYYQNVKSYNAGMITALTNRLGDVAFLMSIAWMLNFGSWNYVYFLDFMNSSVEMSVIVGLMVFAGMTKSAQIPFSSWLPAAMAAPTPVSSLVHSSTLVTAGVYLLIRFNFCMGYWSSIILLFVASLTMFMAGLGASYEYDLKKIIALSTLSQLGLMMSILSMGGYVLAFYHLLTHALFKALLFMCAGAMIHGMGNKQDIRFMGGMIFQMPVTCSFFIICNLSLCGIPFLSGFYSKDLILEVVSMDFLNIYVYVIYFFSTGLTVAYTFRLVYYVIIGDFNFYSFHLISDTGNVMIKGMAGIIFFVVLMGSVLSWTMLSVPYFICLSFLMKMMTVIVVLLGGWFGFELAQLMFGHVSKSMNYIYSTLFFGSMWNMPFLSTFGVNFYLLQGGESIHSSIDQGWSEYLGSQNFYKNLSWYSKFLQIFHENNLKVFLVLTLMWIVFLILMMF